MNTSKKNRYYQLKKIGAAVAGVLAVATFGAVAADYCESKTPCGATKAANRAVFEVIEIFQVGGSETDSARAVPVAPPVVENSAPAPTYDAAAVAKTTAPVAQLTDTIIPSATDENSHSEKSRAIAANEKNRWRQTLVRLRMIFDRALQLAKSSPPNDRGASVNSAPAADMHYGEIAAADDREIALIIHEPLDEPFAKAPEISADASPDAAAEISPNTADTLSASAAEIDKNETPPQKFAPAKPKISPAPKTEITLTLLETLPENSEKLTAEQRDLPAIKKRGALIVGMLAGNRERFFTYQNGQNPRGHDYDFAVALAQKLNVDLTIIRAFASETALLDAVNHGLVDAAISGLKIPTQLPSGVQFSAPYLGSFFTLVVDLPSLAKKFPDREFLEVADLNFSGVTIAVETNSVYEKLAAQLFPQATLIREPSADRAAAFSQLFNGQVDVVLRDNFAVRESRQTQAAAWRNRSGLTVKRLKKPINLYGVAVAPTAPSLLRYLNELNPEIDDSPRAVDSLALK